jgi:hypothetical protein
MFPVQSERRSVAEERSEERKSRAACSNGSVDMTAKEEQARMLFLELARWEN